VLVVPITTALHRLAPTKFLLGSSLVLDVGQKLDVEQMRTRLEPAATAASTRSTSMASSRCAAR
jgi:transcription-repair coupling factor (superfamily II helicase)